MGRKKEKTTSKKEDDDEEVLCSTTRKSERLIAANAAVAAAAPKTAAAATATDALPPVILEGRFEGYMSPGYVAEKEREWERHRQELIKHSQARCRLYHDEAIEDFTRWQDEAFDGLREHFMRRQKMLDEVRSTRTGAPSETAATAAAAAADDTSAAAAAATNAAATTIARLEHELGEMAAAAAAANCRHSCHNQRRRHRRCRGDRQTSARTWRDGPSVDDSVHSQDVLDTQQ